MPKYRRAEVKCHFYVYDVHQYVHMFRSFDPVGLEDFYFILKSPRDKLL